MIYNIQLETLSPIHIGDGQFLSKADIVKFNEDGASYIGIVDPRKVISIIGEDRVQQWISVIENGDNMVDFMKRCGSNATPEDYCSRTIYLINNNYDASKDTLKTCIHDGMKKAYIPGSSIKGAIRSAILSSFVYLISNIEDKIKAENENNHRNRAEKKIQSSIVEDELFGHIQSDIFKYILVGDAIFDEACEIAFMEANLNIRSSHDLLYDSSKRQWVEAIKTSSTTKTRIIIHEDLFKNSKSKNELQNNIRNIQNLFNITNCHTKQIIEDEIEYWSSTSYDDKELTKYKKQLSEILKQINECQKINNSCIIRVGHGCGWKFITGGWGRNLSNFEDVVIPAARPKNNEKYSNYDFPKSRRIQQDGECNGFIKLTNISSL